MANALERKIIEVDKNGRCKINIQDLVGLLAQEGQAVAAGTLMR